MKNKLNQETKTKYFFKENIIAVEVQKIYFTIK